MRFIVHYNHPGMAESFRVWAGHFACSSGTISSDGRLAAACTFSPEVRVVRTDTHEDVHVLMHRTTATRCAFSRDGKILAVGCIDGVFLWDLAIERQFYKWWAGDEVTEIAFSATGLLMACTDNVCFFDTRSMQQRDPLVGHTNLVSCCAISNDERLAVSGDLDGGVILWDVARGTMMRRLESHADLVTSCAISDDATRVLTASPDETLRLWSVRTGSYQVITSAQHLSYPTWCRFLPHSWMFVIGTDRGASAILSVATQRVIWSCREHTQAILEGNVSADGTQMVTASFDGTTRIWRLPNEAVAAPRILLMVVEGRRRRRRIPAELWWYMVDEGFL